MEKSDNNHYAADILIGLVLVATFGPLGAALGVVVAFCRHSPIIIGGLLDMAAAARGGDPLMLTGERARAILPALATLQPAPEAPSASGKAISAQKGAQIIAAHEKPAQSAQNAPSNAPQLAMIDLATLARCSTLLLVGSRGSGKSTLLRAILATKAAAKEELIAVYDPHAHPQAWPMATILHNTDDKISSGLASAYKRLRARKKEMSDGTQIEGWPRFTLAADEWGSIVSNVELPESIKKTPGEISTELMKEGRKFGIGFVAGAHGTTNKSLGCTGDRDAFLASFDWIVSMGGYMRTMLPKEHADLLTKIPYGTNEQDQTFPLIVACESPVTGEIRLLDMRGFNKMVDTRPAPAPAPMPWETPAPSRDSVLLGDMLGMSHATPATADMSQSDMVATASQSDATSCDAATVATPNPAEIAFLSMSLSQGRTVSQAARAMKGYNGRTHDSYMAKAKYVKALIDAQSNQASNEEEDSTDE